MMDSCLNEKPARVGPVVIEDLRKDLFADFSAISSAQQDSVLLKKEHLRVFLRIRPFTSAENESGESQECVSMETPDTVLLRAPRTSLSARLSERPVTQTAQKFQFTQVYGPDTTQRQMFEGSVKRLVKDVLEGHNSLVFTYGVTNAGKTFTFLGPETDVGILPRSLNVIFNSIEGRVYMQNNIKPHRCRDFTRLTKDQQKEDTTNKRNLMRLLKESDVQRSTNSMLSSTCRSTILEGSSLNDSDGQGEADSFILDVDSHTKYSVWVSFCEIYNENIHDLLEPIPNGSRRRTALRLSQDIKANTFVKDLKWVQVNNSAEAYKVMKIGKKNQSFSCTKLNNVSSRSHSIFSIRILRIEDAAVPRVHTVSELSLCDLAGSERCTKTQNKGDRLKEAGNINTSLLTLGKCINSLRLNQQAKFQQHVPFRDSKLTHYLQGFFCGRGKACMIVNINQCASMYDETLNVLKFSAVAQKVVVVSSKPVPAVVPKRSARDVSLIINNADHKNRWSRRTSLMAWETTLEDVPEDDDDDDEEEEEEYEEEEGSCDESMAEETILEAGEEDNTALEDDFNHSQLALVEELKEKLQKEEAEKLTLESRIREEVTNEFMELFSNMESDYNERLVKDREMVEVRADKRLEILKNLVNKSVSDCASVSCDEEKTKEDKVALLEGIIDAMRNDLITIRRDAEAAQTCLLDLPDSPGTVSGLRKQVEQLSEELLKSQQQLNLKINEMDEMGVEKQQSHGQLKEAKENLESQALKFQALMEICHEKDDMISKLQTVMDQNVEAATKDRSLVDSIKEEILNMKQNCKCMSNDGPTAGGEGRKRHADVLEDLEQPALKRGTLKGEGLTLAEELLKKLQAECDCKDLTISQLKEDHEAVVQKLETVKGDFLEKIEKKDMDAEELKRERVSLEQTVKKLNEDLELQMDDCEAVMSSLEKERKETTRLSKDNKSLVNGIFQLQQTSEKAASEVKTLQTELGEHTERSEKLTKEMETTKALLKELENQSNQKSQSIEALTQEVEDVKLSSAQKHGSHFHETIDAMKRECETMMAKSVQKSQQIAELEQEVSQVRAQLSEIEELCAQLRQELDTQRTEAKNHLQSYETERAMSGKAMRNNSDLQVEMGLLKERIMDLEAQVKAFEASTERAVELERQLAEREAQCGALQERLEEAQSKLAHAEEERCGDMAKKGEEETSRVNHCLSAKERQIEDMRLALTEQEKTQEEQEQILEDRMKEIETLRQELIDLKDTCLQKNLSDAKSSHVGNEQERESPKESFDDLSSKQLSVEDLPQSTEGKNSVVEALKLEMQRLLESNAEKDRKLTELHEQSTIQTQEVLDCSEVSTDGVKVCRFPKSEVEILFTPLHPNKLNIRRQGEDEGVTVKLTRSARKRKSNEMEKDPVDSENKKNMRGNTRVNMQSQKVLGVKADQEKPPWSPPSLKGKRDGTLQKIGDFIQSSPILLGSKAKTIMEMVSGRSTEREEVTVPILKAKRTKRKLYKTDISSPMDIPSHPMIRPDQDEKESDHLIIKRQLRSRTARK